MTSSQRQPFIAKLYPDRSGIQHARLGHQERKSRRESSRTQGRLSEGPGSTSSITDLGRFVERKSESPRAVAKKHARWISTFHLKGLPARRRLVAKRHLGCIGIDALVRQVHDAGHMLRSFLIRESERRRPCICLSGSPFHMSIYLSISA